MTRLIIGEIDFLNCLPLFTRLQKGGGSRDDWQFVKGDPARLNGCLAAGSIDISPSSSMEYALRSSRYFLFPRLAISSHREVQSVIFLSRQPLEKLRPGTIALTSQSLTSVYLLQLILFHFHRYEPDDFTFTTGEIQPFTADSPAALVIGDQALHLYHRPPAGFRVYDLGALWYRFTGLPFVYALWIGNRRALDSGDKEEQLRELHRQLLADKSRLPRFFPDLLELTDRLYPRLSREVILNYWQRAISYDLGPRELAGLRLFYRLAHENRLLAAVPRLSFFPDDPQARTAAEAIPGQ
ncbi:MAG: menaquinone biosynthesis protein [Deltaproteobacteria bacterium]|nr:menaquinone biosynthesis protein [Deltaproteobacteria bacterium]